MNSYPRTDRVNLDFEYEWAAHRKGQSYQPPHIMLQVCLRWQMLLQLEEGKRKGPLYWGLTPSLWAALRPEEQAHAPSLEAVQLVNGKCFSHQLEVSLGLALPHACLIDSRSGLEAALAVCPWHWVVKHPWGVSGRERVQGSPGTIEPRHLRWVERQLAQGERLVFEPWLSSRSEFSMHFEIAPDGEIQPIGVCLLVADGSGTHRGNHCGPHVQAPKGAMASALQVVAQVAAQGYFGPVGIDAMTGSLGERVWLRPLMEINARYSFGRLALALAAHLPARCTYSWWHPSAREVQAMRLALPEVAPISSQIEASGFYRLPDLVDPGGQSGSYVLVQLPEDDEGQFTDVTRA